MGLPGGAFQRSLDFTRFKASALNHLGYEVHNILRFKYRKATGPIPHLQPAALLPHVLVVGELYGRRVLVWTLARQKRERLIHAIAVAVRLDDALEVGLPRLASLLEIVLLREALSEIRSRRCPPRRRGSSPGPASASKPPGPGPRQIRLSFGRFSSRKVIVRTKAEAMCNPRCG